MRLVWRALAALLLSLAPAAHAADAPPQSIILASTTSVDNSGLLAAILPGFTKATNISVKVLAQGTARRSIQHAVATPILFWCMTLRRKPSSSAKVTGSAGAKSPGMIS